MRELRPGLWHWTAPHPDWSPTEPSVAHVLPTHGSPTDRAAFERALSDEPTPRG